MDITIIKAALDAVGISLYEQDQERTFAEVMEDIKAKWHEMSMEQKQAITDAFVRFML